MCASVVLLRRSSNRVGLHQTAISRRGSYTRSWMGLLGEFTVMSHSPVDLNL